MSENKNCLCGSEKTTKMPPPPYSAQDIENELQNKLETTYVVNILFIM